MAHLRKDAISRLSSSSLLMMYHGLKLLHSGPGSLSGLPLVLQSLPVVLHTRKTQCSFHETRAWVPEHLPSNAYIKERHWERTSCKLLP